MIIKNHLSKQVVFNTINLTKNLKTIAIFRH